MYVHSIMQELKPGFYINIDTLKHHFGQLGGKASEDLSHYPQVCVLSLL